MTPSPRTSARAAARQQLVRLLVERIMRITRPIAEAVEVQEQKESAI